MFTHTLGLHRKTLKDQLVFLRQWVSNPLETASVTPSGRSLSRAMAAEVDPRSDGVVVELGPGTGVFTDALVERGITPDRLVLIEFSADFAALLAKRYPEATIICGDARDLPHHLRTLGAPKLAAVVSGLPIIQWGKSRTVPFMAEVLSFGSPETPFVQFTYGFKSPIPPRPGRYSARRGGLALKNLPPARVWVYTRD